MGVAKALAWPSGVGGKGNQGVASYVERIPGAIGYVEYAYALQNGMSYTQLRNRTNQLVSPTQFSFKAAAANADWQETEHFNILLTDQPGANSWPITGATFILVPRQPEEPQRIQAALAFFSWAYKNGDAMATELDYVPLPDSLVKQVKDAWQQSLHNAAGQPIWPRQE